MSHELLFVQRADGNFGVGRKAHGTGSPRFWLATKTLDRCGSYPHSYPAVDSARPWRVGGGMGNMTTNCASSGLVIMTGSQADYLQVALLPLACHSH